MALVLAGLVVSAGSIVSAADQPEAEAEVSVPTEMESVSVDKTVSQADLGRELFIAKGCPVCHSHAETNKNREFGIDMGPDLTNLTASPEYLRLWLKDPLAAKSTAQMPQLELSAEEIEALIAFINSD
jgi:cytochrome c2